LPGLTENEGPKRTKDVSKGLKNAGLIMQRWKMQDRKMWDRLQYWN